MALRVGRVTDTCVFRLTNVSKNVYEAETTTTTHVNPDYTQRSETLSMFQTETKTNTRRNINNGLFASFEGLCWCVRGLVDMIPSSLPLHR